MSCSRVRSVSEFVDDPHAQALGLLPLVAGRRVVALPLGFDGERPPPRTPPPRLGEHTDEILNEIAYDEVLVAELRARGTIT
jgi:crotonobetainyl-CoA:carnitine CoA-transferase CaiB-like acyl-CoA transferase